MGKYSQHKVEVFFLSISATGSFRWISPDQAKDFLWGNAIHFRTALHIVHFVDAFSWLVLLKIGRRNFVKVHVDPMRDPRLSEWHEEHHNKVSHVNEGFCFCSVLKRDENKLKRYMAYWYVFQLLNVVGGKLGNIVRHHTQTFDRGELWGSVIA